MWQWYCRCMCPIMTNGFYVFFRVAGQESPLPRMHRPRYMSPKLCINNKIRGFAGRSRACLPHCFCRDGNLTSQKAGTQGRESRSLGTSEGLVDVRGFEPPPPCL
jgi:hypothetical protein